MPGSGLDLSARIIVQDEFSNTITRFNNAINEARKNAESLGKSIAEATKKAGQGSRSGGPGQGGDDFRGMVDSFKNQMQGMAVGMANILPEGVAEKYLSMARAAVDTRVAMEDLENQPAFTQEFVLTQQVKEFRLQLQEAAREYQRLRTGMTQGSIQSQNRDQMRAAIQGEEDNIKRRLLSLAGKAPDKELIENFKKAKEQLAGIEEQATKNGKWGMEEELMLKRLGAEWARYADGVMQKFGVTRTAMMTSALRTAASVLALYWAFRRGLQVVT